MRHAVNVIVWLALWASLFLAVNFVLDSGQVPARTAASEGASR